MKKIMKKLTALSICLSIIFSCHIVFADSKLDRMIDKKTSSPTVSIVVDQPVSGSSYCTDKRGKVGHTFLRLDDGKKTYYVGFYPKDSDAFDDKKVLCLDKAVKSKIRWNDDNHDWDVAYVYKVKSKTIKSVLRRIEKLDVKKYRLQSYNCTTFAADVIKDATDLPLPIKKTLWKVHPTIRKMAIELYGEKANILNFIGYCPGAAGEQIRDARITTKRFKLIND
ncbi:hypothetical protein [Wukongibacter sp. M2B1]|uniref:hypothetical protein n=1 Tax=Wukongibacter sp. M2B1 TaxID=3088895 RepID=UPI003D79C5F6